MISLVVPTYNERQNMAALVSRTDKALSDCGEEYELIIVDDSSPDGTAEEVRLLQRDRPWLKLLVREKERDLSTAVLAGWESARGEILGCMDGDLQHPPEHLLELVARQRETGAGVVIGSRYVPEGGVSDWKFRRRIISWTATALAAAALPGRIGRVRDPMSGFFLVKRSVIDGARLKPSGYKILLEVLAHSPNDRVEEAPYVFEERTSGGSKMGAGQIGIYLLQLVRLAAATGELPRLAASLLVESATLLLNVYLLLWLYKASDVGIAMAAGIAAVAAACVKLLLRAAVSATLGRGSEHGLRIGNLRSAAAASTGVIANVATVWSSFSWWKLGLAGSAALGAVVAAIVFSIVTVSFSEKR